MQPKLVEHLPYYISQSSPEFGWQLPVSWSTSQNGYEIEISKSDNFSKEDVVWSSGKVSSTQSQNIKYTGPILNSYQQYFTRVRVFGKDGSESDWSKSGKYETTKLSSDDWKAEMISPLSDQGPETRCPTVTQSFDLDDIPSSAHLYISALGLYQVHVNDKRVGNDELTPGWTSYSDRLGYQTYDVSSFLKAGKNTIIVILADGWYRGRLFWPPNDKNSIYGDKIGCIAEIRIVNKDDTITTIATDNNWRSGLSPYLFSSIYDGETYDARLQGADQDKAGVEILDFNCTKLVSQESETVRVIEEFSPVKSEKTKDGSNLYDFGQNIAGVVLIEVRGDSGSKVTINHAEIILDGDLGLSSLRSAKAEVTYILSGNEIETYQPSFTFMGFRHVRVQIKGNAEIISIKSLALSSALKVTGNFSSGDELINRLHENASWSLNGNFVDVPTDCPQRDERLGWTGDAQVFCPLANYMRDGQQFFKKYLRDMVADQRKDGGIPYTIPDATRHYDKGLPNFYGSTGWADAICNIPWTIYLFYGDTDVLSDCLPAMQGWVDFLNSYAPNGIVENEQHVEDKSFTFGDWLQPTDFEGILPPNSKPNPNTGDDYISTVFLYSSALITAKTANVLGKKEIADKYNEIAKTVKTAFQKEFITSSGRVATDSQGSYLLALYHDLLPNNFVPIAISRLEKAILRNEHHIATGFITTSIMLQTLSKVGLHKHAIKLLLQKTKPSWLYQVTKGATTIWERWDSIDLEGTESSVKMNSYNHYAFGAVVYWFYHNLAGIQPDITAPGFEKITLAPEFYRELSPINANYSSRRGKISAKWNFEEDKVNYEVLTPAGTTSTLKLPSNVTSISIDDKLLSKTESVEVTSNGLLIQSGKHKITMTISDDK